MRRITLLPLILLACTFPVFAQITWTEHLITHAPDIDRSVLVDMDSDGDLDIFAAICTNPTDFWWWENAGGNWVRHSINQYFAGSQPESYRQLRVADLNQDGVMEIVTLIEDADFTTRLSWWQQRTGGCDENPLEDGADTDAYIKAFELGDLDGDDYLDIVYSVDRPVGWQTDTNVEWYANPTGGMVWQQYVVYSDLPYDPFRGFLIDVIDYDDTVDIVGFDLPDRDLVYFDSNGQVPPTFSLVHMCTNGTAGADELIHYDVNFDGFLDILFPWNWCDYNENNWTLRDLGDTYPTLLRAHSAADIDGDGDLDLLTDINNSNEFGWIERSTDSYDYRPIGVRDSHRYPVAGDIDGDGDTDVFLNANGTLYWYEQSNIAFMTGRTAYLANIGAISDDSIPGEYNLTGPYPNPFNPATTLTLFLPEPAPLSISVYGVDGRLAERLAETEIQTAGQHMYTIDGSNWASGIYFIRVDAGPFHATRKLVLLK